MSVSPPSSDQTIADVTQPAGRAPSRAARLAARLGGGLLSGSLVDEVSCTTGEDGNRWHLVKRLPLAGGTASAETPPAPTNRPTARSTPAEAQL